jgi:hypothetical protein
MLGNLQSCYKVFDERRRFREHRLDNRAVHGSRAYTQGCKPSGGFRTSKSISRGYDGACSRCARDPRTTGLSSYAYWMRLTSCPSLGGNARVGVRLAACGASPGTDSSSPESLEEFNAKLILQEWKGRLRFP